MKLTVKKLVARAKKYGTYMVFETAIQNRMGIEDLADLAKELRAIQNTSRKGWNLGVPNQYDKHGRFGSASNLWRSPQGILGEYDEVMVRALLSLRYPDTFIIDRLGVKPDFIEKIRQDIIGEAEVDIAEIERINRIV